MRLGVCRRHQPCPRPPARPCCCVSSSFLTPPSPASFSSPCWHAVSCSYGAPTPTQVSLDPVEGKCILITGHDMHDLHMLLQQTEGKVGAGCGRRTLARARAVCLLLLPWQGAPRHVLACSYLINQRRARARVCVCAHRVCVALCLVLPACLPR